MEEFEVIKEEKNKSKKVSIFIIMFILLVAGVIIIFVLNMGKNNIENIKNSVVKIIAYNSQNVEIGTGSGFCLYEPNYIITNYHVIEGAYRIEIITDDNECFQINNVEVFSPKYDLAIMSGNFELTPLRTGNALELKAGQEITTISSPEGVLNNVSSGIISNADDNYEIRITAPISPGSSGGVLLNDRNRVIGVIYATYNSDTAQNINYAVSVNHLQNMYNSIDNAQVIKSESLEFTSEDHPYNDKMDERFSRSYYRTKNIYDFYRITSPIRTYEYYLYLCNKVFGNSEFEKIYKTKDWLLYYQNLTDIEKFNIADHYLKTDYDKWGQKHIGELNQAELIGRVCDLSIVNALIVNEKLNNCYSAEEVIATLDSLPLEREEKLLIGNVCYDYTLSISDKEDIFVFLDARYEVERLGEILEYLGYIVQYNSNGTLTAWW